MLNIDNTLKTRVIFHAFFILNFILITGLINSSWIGLLAWITLFSCIYSADITFDKKKWFIVISLTIFCFGIKSFLKTPYITEGSNVFIGGKAENSVFEKKLPPIIFNHLNNDFIKKFPNNISGPSASLFDNSVSKIIRKSPESRNVKSIDWENRYDLQLSAFNNTKYNAYGEQQPQRDLLPFFVKYTFPNDFKNKNSQLCWKGQAYLKLEKYKSLLHSEKECIFIQKYFEKSQDTFTIWLIETGNTPRLNVSFIPPKIISIKNLVYKYFSVVIAIFSCFIIYENFRRFKLLFFGFSFSFSFLLMYFFQNSILDKFLLFEGGNDGLLYVHFAHLIADSLISSNYLEAFRGGENAYDLMPFYRYFWVINYILFDESPWIVIFTVAFLPLVLFNIIKNLLGKPWSIFLIFCWYLFPIFEAFGFFHFYYVKLAMRGFAEPLSNLFFFSSIALIIHIYKINKSVITKESINYFFLGFMLSLSLGLRANILPAFLVLAIYMIVVLLKERKFISVICLGIGLSPCLIMPIHNFYFTKEFIPLTIAAYKDWNLGARPIDYITFLLSILKLDIDLSLWKKITSHISGEIKFYEIWYHVSIFSAIYVAMSKKSDKIIKLISWAALSMLILILFYHVGGRYSYLTWTLCLIVFSYWIKNNLFPLFKRMRN